MTLAAAVEEHGLQATMQAVINTTAAHRGWAQPFDIVDIPGLPVAAGPEDLGPIYEDAITSNQRKSGGIYYTPQPLAEFTTRFALDDALGKVAEINKPASVLRLVVVDPSCGGGIFLVCAVRILAKRFVQLLSGEEDPPDWAVRMAMPEVAYQCIFGMDIDPVAIDMARSAVWLAGDGHWMPSLLERNIAVADPLNNEQPPALTERLGRTDPPPEFEEAG